VECCPLDDQPAGPLPSFEIRGKILDTANKPIPRNVFHNNRPPFVQTGKVIGVKWLDSLTSKPDTIRRPPH
jgi:hypothetical protein